MGGGGGAGGGGDGALTATVPAAADNCWTLTPRLLLSSVVVFPASVAAAVELSIGLELGATTAKSTMTLPERTVTGSGPT